jgi:hypothetical protein
MCGYKNLNSKIGSSWLIKDEDQLIIKSLDADYHKLFCENCYLESSLSAQSQQQAVLTSPIIELNKKYLRFVYKLEQNIQLRVGLVYEKDFSGELDLNNLVMLGSFDESTSDEWKKVEIEMGRFLLSNYRLIFISQVKVCIN